MPPRTGGLDRPDPRHKLRIVYFNGRGETGICGGVFMPRADQRVVGQGAQLAQAVPHLLRCALEQAAASQRHQAVGGKDGVAVGKVEGDMPDGMARHLDHYGGLPADHDLVTLGDGKVERGQAVDIGGGTDHAGTVRAAQIVHACDVVVVVVRDQDVRQAPAPRGKRCGDRRGFRRIDKRGLSGRAVMQKKCVVVGPARDGNDVQGHGKMAPSCYVQMQASLKGTVAAMHLDVLDLRNFYYRSALGRAAQKVIRDKLVTLWPEAKGQTVVGFGFAVPLLRPFLADARRVIGLMPGPQGVMPWPAGQPNVSVLCEETLWPVQTGQADKLVVLHGLETCEHPTALLEECWRVLGPGGKAVFIVPNRAGLWSRRDATPFGYGRPYSLGQLETQLRLHRFQPERAFSALYQPPSHRQVWRRAAAFMESAGRHLPTFAAGGVLIVEVTKMVNAPTRPGLPVKARRPMRVLDALPTPAAMVGAATCGDDAAASPGVARPARQKAPVKV